ncbi:MAG: isocitrate/isopropylmalate dehydrogenase family protein [Burkholderiaceae bacterium]
MSAPKTFTVASLPGDGIGPEVVSATRQILVELEQCVPEFHLSFVHYDAGATHFQATGEPLPDETLKACEQADAIFLGAMGLPDVRSPAGTEISPQLDIRDRFELFAGVRPIITMPGLPPVLAAAQSADIDLVLIREQTEGFFYGRGKTEYRDGVAYDTMAISEQGTRRLTEFALAFAGQRGPRRGASKPRLTLVDKANVFGSMAYFREVFLSTVGDSQAVDTDCAYVDAVSLNLVRQPWIFDVIVTENQFGDILSDLCAGLIGSMGLAPSADIGLKHAMFQPAHGSAPDIVGRGLANPVAAILSAAMMLEWLGAREPDPIVSAAATKGANLLDSATRAAFADGRLIPPDFGGGSGTADITAAIMQSLRRLAASA